MQRRRKHLIEECVGDLLYSDPEVSSVALRGFLTPDEALELLDNLSTQEEEVDDANITTTYEHIPELKYLDKLVDEYNKHDCPEGFVALSGLAHADLKSECVDAHIDGVYDEIDETYRLYGPITGSLRLDYNDAPRRLSVQPWPGSPDGSISCINDGSFIHIEPCRTWATRKLGHYYFPLMPSTVNIQQETGDLVVFKNHPFPAPHASYSAWETQALIIGYWYQGSGQKQKELRELRLAELDKFPKGWRWG